MEFLLDGIRAVTPQQCVMYVVGALLIYLAIKKDYEPCLLYTSPSPRDTR